MYFVALLEPTEGEKIDIQMENEIKKADWLPLVSNYRYNL